MHLYIYVVVHEVLGKRGGGVSAMLAKRTTQKMAQ